MHARVRLCQRVVLVFGLVFFFLLCVLIIFEVAMYRRLPFRLPSRVVKPASSSTTKLPLLVLCEKSDEGFVCRRWACSQFSSHNLVDSPQSANLSPGVNKFTFRTHTCKEINVDLVGTQVKLAGWVEFHRQGRFVVLRDTYGTVQLFINDKETQKLIKKLSLESVIRVTGDVVLRPDHDVNPVQVNGNIEVCVKEFELLSEATPKMPFLPRDYMNVGEVVRLQHRYIDLRRSQMAQTLRLRSQLIGKFRKILAEQFGFIEVETPTLFKPTPGVSELNFR